MALKLINVSQYHSSQKNTQKIPLTTLVLKYLFFDGYDFIPYILHMFKVLNVC